MTTALFHSLKISDLSLQVRLGCSVEERSRPQEVRVGLEMRFHDAPEGSFSDRLEETICYAEISAAFRQYCQDREFSLVEKLACDLLMVAREHLGRRAALAVTTHKVAPPVEGLLGGVIYRVGDFL